ncbi:MAG: DUF104 domain-containing protein [Chloroflexota bacterium]|nr:DUF104 domain-containing protein [Chloroflexota bacterium]
MTLRLKAEYINGTLKPLEPLNLEEGTVVTLSIEQDEAIESEEEADSLLAMMEKIWESLPEGVLENLPTDGSINYKHYLYGNPKEKD